MAKENKTYSNEVLSLMSARNKLSQELASASSPGKKAIMGISVILTIFFGILSLVTPICLLGVLASLLIGVPTYLLHKAAQKILQGWDLKILDRLEHEKTAKTYEDQKAKEEAEIKKGNKPKKKTKEEQAKEEKLVKAIKKAEEEDKKVVEIAEKYVNNKFDNQIKLIEKEQAKKKENFDAIESLVFGKDEPITVVKTVDEEDIIIEPEK